MGRSDYICGQPTVAAHSGRIQKQTFGKAGPYVIIHSGSLIHSGLWLPGSQSKTLRFRMGAVRK